MADEVTPAGGMPGDGAPDSTSFAPSSFCLETFEVSGHQLIEAGAGTGKTYSLVNIYLGLVLSGRSVPEILVVTFTNAATDELRGRVRRRLREALDSLGRASVSASGGGTECCDDEDLEALRVKHSRSISEARRLVRDAIVRMDEASIYTIHGFCNRALRENAFLTGLPFDVEFLVDDGDSLLQAAEDVWRRSTDALPAVYVETLLKRWPRGPEDIVHGKDKPPFGLARGDLRIRPDLSSVKFPEDFVGTDPGAAFEEARDALRVYWSEHRERVLAEFLEDRAALSRGKYTDKFWEGLETEFEGFLIGKKKLKEQFGWTKISTSVNKGKAATHREFYDLCQNAIDTYSEREESVEEFRRVGVPAMQIETRRRAAALRRERGVVSSDDLLTRLSEALAADQNGQLQKRLRGRYPVALVDEFQDTDSLQFRIFSSIYPPSTEDGGLVMIGDPKQAIYAFRGADIYTYLDARGQTHSGCLHTLTTNWRSTPALVEAVNRVFTGSPDPFAMGGELPFLPAVPGPKKPPPLRIDGVAGDPLQFWIQREAFKGKGQAGEEAARAVAGHIGWLLSKGRASEARIGDRDVEPGDVAILVSTGTQAKVIRDALHRQGVPCVTQTRDGVFESSEAADLRLLLGAILEPKDAAKARAALTVGCLAMDTKAVAAVIKSEAMWGRWSEHLVELNARWRTRGFSAMFHRLIAGAGEQRFSIDQMCGRQLQGERMLTNLLHLGEILQEASHREHGMDGLQSWFLRQIDGGEPESESLLRLESDANLVRIQTIHASKGLEYPVVYLPFCWAAKPQSFTKGKGHGLLYRDSDRTKVWDLDPDDLAKGLADRKRLGEDLRLLYVAMTRACQQLYVPWMAAGKPARGKRKDEEAFSGSASSALAYLLYGDASASGSGAPAAPSGPFCATAMTNKGFADAMGEHAVVPWDDVPAPRSPSPEDEPDKLRARPFTGTVVQNWRVSSYSGLLRNSHDPVDRDRFDAATALPAAEGSVHAFPRGTRTGNFMHSLLEEYDFCQAPATVEDNVGRLLLRHGLDAWWQPLVLEWLELIRTTAIEEGGLSLSGVSPDERSHEMDFFFRADSVDASQVGNFLERIAGRELPPLGFPTLHGMLNGQIDLVYRSSGRYFVADFKTNHLGNNAAAYTPEALEAAMIQHRYDLQYAIYSVALHRHLSRCLKDYSPERDFGGVRYLFLRGMDGSAGAGVYRGNLGAAELEEFDSMLGGAR